MAIKLKIHKGKPYLCVKDLKSGGRSFVKKGVYISDKDGFITDADGVSRHILADASHFREWSVAKDARDGDVLVVDDGTSVKTSVLFKSVDKGVPKVRYHFDSFFRVIPDDGCYYGLADNYYIVRPADEQETREFFEMLDECGYEWDKDNKQVIPKQDAER